MDNECKLERALLIRNIKKNESEREKKNESLQEYKCVRYWRNRSKFRLLNRTCGVSDTRVREEPSRKGWVTCGPSF